MSHNNRHITTLPDGRLAIISLGCEDGAPEETRFITKTLFELSRSEIKPPDGMTDKKIAEWRNMVHFDEYTGAVPLTCRVCTVTDLPCEQLERASGAHTFRDAWEDTGTAIRVNMPKARVIHMDRIREKRNEELQKLDIPFMTASERNDQANMEKISVQKQKLRDIPQTYDLSGFKTPEELKAFWPKELEELDERIKDVKKAL